MFHLSMERQVYEKVVFWLLYKIVQVYAIEGSAFYVKKEIT